MEQTQFMGLLIVSIGTLLAIASIIVAIIIKPIINLNKSITKLNDSIDRLNDDNASLAERVTKHGQEIDENTKKLIVHDQEINHLKEHIR
ncbi:MAG: hypothetical protein IJJ10_06505 [Bacillus sp. (in: Bacteria)]|nr:hypothetical protein [Bacillus sp. (in: firmicutes)]